MTMPPRRWIAAGLLVTATLLGVAPGPAAQVRGYVTTRVAMDVGGPSDGAAYEASSATEVPAVRLAAVGDVGTGDREEHETAQAMASLPGAPYDALVLLGDNVYPSGDPRRLDATVFGPFADVLDTADLVAALGNHDVKDGDGPRQVASLGMPGRWYTWRSGPVEIIVLDSTSADDPAQRAWLEDTLATSDATWKLVAVHHPPYSAGWHGSSKNVRAAFEPLFNRVGVQLVLAGHDHDYQRSEPINGTTYVVSGAGAKSRPTDRAWFTAVSWSTQHFVDIQVWPDRLELQAVAQDGPIYDRVGLRP